MMFTFLKDKLFNQTTAFLSPFVLLIAIFVIWNSDLILTNLGYETRSNLKAQVVELQGIVNNLKEENSRLKKEIADKIAMTAITDKTVDDFYDMKIQAKETVDELIRKRDQINDTEVCLYTSEPKLEVQRVLSTPVIKDSSAVSKANITIIHEAYASFFPENK